MTDPAASAALAPALQAHGALAVFGAVTLESIFAFVPTPPVILAAGAMLVPEHAAAAEALRLLCWRVALPGALGTAAGGSALYALFWAGGRPLVERFGKWFGVSWGGVEGLRERLSRRRALLIFVSRALPVIPTALVSAGCGVLRVSLWPFVLWTFLGSFPRWLVLGWLGWAGRTGAAAAWLWLKR